MKVAIVHPRFSSFTGAENLAIELANGLVDAGHEVCVFTGDFPRGIKTTRFAVKQVVLNMHPNTRSQTIQFLRQELAGFDVVNYHNFPSGMLVQLALRRMRDRPKTVWYCHEPYDKRYGKSPQMARRIFLENFVNPRYRLSRWLDRRLMRRTDVLIANSNRTANFAEYIYKRKFNTVYPMHLSSASFDERNLTGKREQIIFAVGRITRSYKNIETILQAYTHVHRQYPEFRFVFAGSGDDYDYFSHWVQEASLGDSVSFPGFINDEQVTEYFQKAALVLNLSLDEPFGLIAIEPAPYGAPVLNSTLSGASEVLQDGHTAYLCDPRDPQLIARKIVSILHDDEGRRQIARNAFNFGKKNYVIDRTVYEFLRLIE